MERALPAPWCGRRLTALEAESGARLVAVTRAGIPQLGPGELIGQEGDILHLAVTFAARTRLDELLAGPAGGGPDGGRAGR